MREIERTSQFRRDFKREMKGRYRGALQDLLMDVLGHLAQDMSLPERCRDHPLTGPWTGFRDFHVKPDLVLIYEKPDATTLRLVRVGSDFGQ
jgi:mRNA interferase YafQ